MFCISAADLFVVITVWLLTSHSVSWSLNQFLINVCLSNYSFLFSTLVNEFLYVSMILKRHLLGLFVVESIDMLLIWLDLFLKWYFLGFYGVILFRIWFFLSRIICSHDLTGNNFSTFSISRAVIFLILAIFLSLLTYTSDWNSA